MNDDDFDNGIDGTPWASNSTEDSAERCSEEEYVTYELGGVYLHKDSANDTEIIYYYGQWNDSGVDPDKIALGCNVSAYEDKEYRVWFDRESAWIKVPEKKAFELNGKFSLKDFVDYESPVNIECMRTNFDDLQDALSEGKVKFIFDKEKFIAKLERYRGLLVFS